MGDRNQPLVEAALRLSDGPGNVVRARNSRPHDARKLRISLKQWRMLHAVIDCGGFADAAKFLHLSQSAISYTVAKMQEQLGVPILQLVGRKAHITEVGRELLEQSRYLLKEALELEAFADTIRQGGGSELQLVVDQDFPTALLMMALRQFDNVASNTRVCLRAVAMAEPARALNERTADLAITAQIPPGFFGDLLLELEYVAVAHPSHPLFGLGRNITASDLKRQVKIVVGHARDPLQPLNKIPTVGCLQNWSVSSIDAAVDALGEALGFAWLPTYRLRDRLHNGDLKRLPLVGGGVFRVNFYLVHGHYRGPDSRVSQLAEVLQGTAVMGLGTSMPR